MDKKEMKAVMIETLKLVIVECLTRGYEDAAIYFGQILMIALDEFMRDYPEDFVKH